MTKPIEDARDASPQASRCRPRWRYFGFIAGGVGLGALGFNANMIVTGLGIVALPLALVSLLVSIRRPRHVVLSRFGDLAALLSVLIVNDFSLRYQNWRLEQSIMPIISALDSYRVAVGTFPERLGQLLPGFATTLPHCPDGRPLRYTRVRHNGNDEFTIRCVTFGFNKHRYDSRTRFWYDWD